MASPVRTSIDEVSELDDEFQAHLERGAELLVRGDAESARVSLAHAAELRRDDPKTLGLLGQALYRLGRFDEAAALFGKLVEQNPLEPGAQVNLGLANLRAKRYVEAISHLERALDLNPEHRKAMGYLGLAWLEHGNVARAREWFSRAGSEHMVGRCDELLQAARRSAPPPGDPQWTVGSPAQAAKTAVEPPRAIPEDDEAEIASAMRVLGDPPKAADAAVTARAEESPSSKGSTGWKLSPITIVGTPARCTDAGPIPLTPAPRRQEPSAEVFRAAAAPDPSSLPDADDLQIDVVMPVEASSAEGAAVPSAAVATAETPAESARPAEAQPVEAPPAPELPAAPARPRTLEDIVAAGLPASEPAEAPTFSLERGVLRVAVRGEVLSRVSSLVATRGDVEMAPETRRYRGRGTDKLFGEGRDAIHRIRGEGALLVRTAGSRYTVLDLAGSAGFFREDCVFAMEASIAFDNARLTARAGPDVDLVQLRGEGAFVLVTHGDIVSVDVSEASLRVAASALVGWTGALTPRLTTLAEGASGGDARAVELTGEGRVLLDSGTAGG